MSTQSRACQIEALAILHQMRSKSAHGGDAQGTTYPEISQMCHGNSPSTFHEGRNSMTIAQRARASMFARLMDILCQNISIEEEMYTHMPRNKMLPEFPKDSIELKNICLRLAGRDSVNSPSDRDLRDLQRCLKCITSNLLILCGQYDCCSLSVTEKFSSRENGVHLRFTGWNPHPLLHDNIMQLADIRDHTLLHLLFEDGPVMVFERG